MSKVIFKMSFKHPNLPDSKSKNASHVDYIANRPGVDKTYTENDLKKELESGAEELAELTGSHNEIIDTNEVRSENTTYVNYIDSRPRSHGLFGEDGLEDPEAIQEELKNHDGFVWRCIISLKEEDAVKLGYINKEEWQNTLRKNLPDIGLKMGIPYSNLKWVGAVHMEKGHPHAHVMIWEKEQSIRTKGSFKPKVLESIKKQLVDDIFETERLDLLNQKNSMRDLIQDLAKGDVSKASILSKEVKETGGELEYFIADIHNTGVCPRLSENREVELAKSIQELSGMLPDKGRVMLKFMPENVKDKVSIIVDQVLDSPDMKSVLLKNLNAVEQLTRLYTGKDEAIQKARNNALEDVKERLGQVVLKGAVECNKTNKFVVDQELAQKTIDVIKVMNNSISLEGEQSKVLKEIANNLLSANLNRSEISSHLKSFTIKENLQIDPDFIEKSIDEVLLENKDPNVLDSKIYANKIDRALSALKVAEYGERDAFDRIEQIIDEDHLVIKSKLDDLTLKGILKVDGSNYSLSDKGVEEFLAVKELDRAEDEIFKTIHSDDTNTASFEDLLQNKDILSKLYNRDPDEFSLSKFDLKIRGEFGDTNTLNLEELENRIYDKYTDQEQNVDEEKAIQEYDILKNRITKLALNGYVELNKSSNTYSFTNDSKKYFEINKRGSYSFTDEAKALFNISTKMDFTKYDATITLKYLDASDNGVITSGKLKEIVQSEVSNGDAEKQYNYLIWRMNNLKEQGFLKGGSDSYELTEKGKEKRIAIMEPKRELLKKELNYLKELGLLDITEDGKYKATNTFRSFIDNKKKSLDSEDTKPENLIGKDIIKLIESTKNRIDPDKMKRTYENLSRGKWINDGYKDIPTSYEELRGIYKIPDTISKTVNTLSTALLVSGMDLGMVKDILKDWNTRGNRIDPKVLEELIDKADKVYSENKTWGKITVISPKDWKDAFRNLNFDEDLIPKWMYRGENWESLKSSQGFNIANQLWKGMWKELEQQSKQVKAQAEWMKKNTFKQTDLSVSAKKEMAKKHRSSTLYRDDELEQ